MFRLLMLLAVVGTVVGVVVGGLALGGMIDTAESGCPYGYGNSRPGSASTTCKPRPEPSPAQMAAALDGSALANGLAAFRKSEDAGADVLGVGLNAYGETTFSIPDGENAFGAPEQRHATFDRTGKLAPADNAFRRNYATATSDEKVPIGKIRPASVRKALARVRRGAPEARFRSALFSRKVAAPGFGWALDYSVGKGDGIHGFRIEMDADGGGLCAFGTSSEVRGVEACAFGRGGMGGAPPEPSGSAPPSAAPVAPQNEQLECVRRAAGDVAKLQKCVSG